MPGGGAGQPIEFEVTIVVLNIPERNLPEFRIAKAIAYMVLHHVSVVTVGGRGDFRLAFFNPGQRKINKHHVGVVLLHLPLAGVFHAQSVQLFLGPTLVVRNRQLQIKPLLEPPPIRVLQVENRIVFTVNFHQPACYHSYVPSCNHLAISFSF